MNMNVPHPSDLSRPARLAWLVVNLLGLSAALLFFAWVEQDGDPAPLGRLLGWPWISWGFYSPLARMAWDAGLFAAFGLVHTVLAQVSVQRRLRAAIPAPAVRSFYLAASGFFLLLMMGLWQPTRVTIWRLPVSPIAEQWLAAATFTMPAAVVLWLVGRLGFWEFVGWKQLFAPASSDTRTAGTPMLRTTGIYGHVRHPVYTGLLAMFILGPTLSLDRLTLFIAALAYLAVGIPVEERKLIALFGPAYIDYRRQVPALLPLGRRAVSPRYQSA